MANSIFLWPGIGQFSGGSFTPTSPILAPDGSKAAPSYSFINDTDSGLYRAGENDIRLSVGNNDHFQANSNGLAVTTLFIDIVNRDVLLTRESGTAALLLRNGTINQTFKVGPSTGFAFLSNTGLGYATGLGGIVTQLTSKSTGVTLDKITGEITMDAAALAADTTVSFILTNSLIALGDYVTIQHISGGTAASYIITALAAAGSATINVHNATPASKSEAIVLKFMVFKSAIS